MQEDSYRRSLAKFTANRMTERMPTEPDAASLAEYEKLLRELAKTPVPRDLTRPDPGSKVETDDRSEDHNDP
jgi:hypothetical protein